MRASLLIGGIVMAASLTLPVSTLAEITTQALLVVFIIVNAALIGVKRQQPEAAFSNPAWVPWFGLIACLVTLVASLIGLLA